VSSIEAVVFDLDGVIVDSEHVWDEVREELAHQRHGRWHEHAQADMMGMSAPEWSRYMHKVIGLTESPAEINELVVTRMLERYEEALPLIDGTVDVVLRLAETFRLALASSSNRLVIDSVLDHAARRLNVPPARCAAIEELGKRPAGRARREHARDSDPEPPVPAGGGGTWARRCRPHPRQ
jgi:beta-phosphoglucomutase-like phosphatase (HAD superfamily)